MASLSKDEIDFLLQLLDRVPVPGMEAKMLVLSIMSKLTHTLQEVAHESKPEISAKK